MNTQQFQSFVNALNQITLVVKTDLSGRITAVNENFCKTSGYSESDFLGHTFKILSSKTHPRFFFKEMWHTLEQGNVWFGELCNRKKSGELYWIQATIFPIYDESESISEYAAISFDVTARRESEVLTQHLASNYRSVIEFTDGFCHIAPSGKILDVSDGYCALSGYSREELLKMNLLDMNEDFSLNLQQFNTLLLGKGKSIDILQYRKDGSHWLAEVNVTYSRKDNSLFLFLHDVTEIRAVEKHNEELRRDIARIQKLESISRLTAGVAHDFNNILGGIFGYNELNKMIIQSLEQNNDTEDLKDNFEQIGNAVGRCAELIEKMLTYCNQNVTRENINIEPTKAVIHEALKIIKPAITSKFDIQLDIDNDAPDIQLDKIDLTQIVTNLLINARDAMEDSGEILVRFSKNSYTNAECAACVQKINGDFIELSFADAGSGMTEELISKIFDPFFTTKDVGKGTGLGLSVVSGIVHKVQGHIIVDSTIGIGTTFKLLFPVSENS
jgi:PAS domain S-box-containing protein